MQFSLHTYKLNLSCGISLAMDTARNQARLVEQINIFILSQG